MFNIVDKILSRLGIYDIVGVWLSGALITYLTKIMIDLFWGKEYLSILNTPFLAFIICYFVGLIFQEFTSLIHKTYICQDKNKCLKNAILPVNQHYLLLEEKEIKTINEYVVNKLNLDTYDGNENIIYNHCKNYYNKNTTTIHIDRDQAIAAMARSLSFYCFFAIVIPLSYLLHLVKDSPQNYCSILLMIALIFLFIGLGCLLYSRFKRFTYRRFITIYRFYLYNEIWKKTKNKVIVKKKHS